MITSTQERKLQLLAQLHQVYDRVASSTDLKEFSQSTVEAIRTVFGYRFVGVSLWEGNQLILYSNEAQLCALEPLSFSRTLVEDVARTGQPATISALKQASEANTPPRYLISEVAVPLLSQDQILGVLNVESADKPLSADDYSLILVVAGHVSLRLGQIRLFNSLQKSEERNLAMLHALPDLMFLKSKEGVYLDYHASRKEDLFVPPEVFLGKHSAEVMPPNLVAQFLPFYNRAVETGELQVTEYKLGLANDERYFEARIVPCGTDKVLTIIRDITERKRAELVLAKRAADMEAVNRMKDEFLASMSHELRTPLNAILGFGESLQEGVYGELTQQQQSILSTMGRSGRHLLALINDVLDVAKIESGKLQLDFNDMPVQENCESSIHIVKEEIRKKRIRFSHVFDHNVQTVRADGRRLIQILVNLLSNAVKFTPEGGQMGLEVIGDPEHKSLQFIVWDSGIGIASEDQERIFEPFIQLDSSLSRQYEGTGLGLTLVRRLIQMHQGTVTVESQLGKGARFTVTLPWEQPNQSEVAELQPAHADPVRPTVKQRTIGKNRSAPLILLAEDNAQNATVMEDFLKSKQYQVLIAQNGLQAVEQASYHTPDLILMDIQMPEMDGLAATRRIRSHADLAKIPIIALTAFAMPGDRERCSEAGVSEYLSKPISLRHLVKVIEGHLQAVG